MSYLAGTEQIKSKLKKLDYSLEFASYIISSTASNLRHLELLSKIVKTLSYEVLIIISKHIPPTYIIHSSLGIPSCLPVSVA